MVRAAAVADDAGVAGPKDRRRRLGAHSGPAVCMPRVQSKQPGQSAREIPAGTWYVGNDDFFSHAVEAHPFGPYRRGPFPEHSDDSKLSSAENDVLQRGQMQNAGPGHLFRFAVSTSTLDLLLDS